jgi:hypothetical protein
VERDGTSPRLTDASANGWGQAQWTQAVLAAVPAERTLDADTGGMNLLYGASGVALALYDYALPGPTPWPALLLLT